MYCPHVSALASTTVPFKIDRSKCVATSLTRFNNNYSEGKVLDGVIGTFNNGVFASLTEATKFQWLEVDLNSVYYVYTVSQTYCKMPKLYLALPLFEIMAMMI